MADLGLSVPHARGRKQKAFAVKKRELTEEDIEALWNLEEGDLKSQPSALLKIRDTHHLLAMLISSGRKQEEVSRITGYSPSYISNIKNDPAFKNLLAYYREMSVESFREASANLFERLNAVSMVASEELLERLTTKPEDFTNREIMEAVALTADRTGFGPQTRNTNVNVNVDLAPRLQRARERSGLALSAPMQASGQEGQSATALLPLISEEK